jgi:hypothetical protein
MAKNEAEKTGIQVLSQVSSELLGNPLPKGYATYRLIRKDPTIALARALVAAPILAGKWSIECDEDAKDEMVDFLTKLFLELRPEIMEPAVYGCIDFGFSPFEVVLYLDRDQRTSCWFKPLLQDLTTIRVDEKTGAFKGYRQHSKFGAEINLNAEKCLHVVFQQEAGNLYGNPLLENARAAYNMWNECNDGARRFDRKMAGAQLVIKYPVGTTPFNGEETDNSVIADSIGRSWQATGIVKIPQQESSYAQDKPQWEISMMDGVSGGQTSFISRLKYLDVLKVRGLLLPERTILEGEHGTKAEAGVHVAMAIAAREQLARQITLNVNKQVLDKLVELNWGEEQVGKVRLVQAPLVDEDKKFLQELYLAVLNDPTAFAQELASYDLDSMKDKLSIPKNDSVTGVVPVPKANEPEVPEPEVPAQKGEEEET